MSTSSRILRLNATYRAAHFSTTAPANRFSAFTNVPFKTSPCRLPIRRLPSPRLPRRRHLSSHSRRQPSNPPELSDSIRSRFLPEFSRVYGKHLASRPDENAAILQSLARGYGTPDEDASAARHRQHYACLSAREAEAAGVSWHDVSVRRVPGKLTDYHEDVGPRGRKVKGAGGGGVGSYDRYKQESDMTLRVYAPPNMTRDAPVVVYFPSGGFVFGSVELEHGLAAHLSVLTASMVVSVGYRAAPAHGFPVPVYDAVAAVDWVRTNLAGWEWDIGLMEFIPSSDVESEAAKPRRKIALLGNGSGGSLAVTIGVTEGMQKGIDAIGAWCPITDWTFDPVPSLPQSKYSSLPKSPAALLRMLREEFGEARALEDLPLELKQQLNLTGRNGLLELYDDIADNPFLSTKTMELLRDVYLPNSSNWTDPFASPLFFFKTPGLEAGEIPEDPLYASEYPEIYGIDSDGGPILGPTAREKYTLPDPPPKKRTYRRRLLYPRNEHLPLTVPPMRLTLAGSDVLYKQGLEFGNAVRASVYPPKSGRVERTPEEVEMEEDGVLRPGRQGEPFPGGLFDPKRPADYYDDAPDTEEEAYRPEAEEWVEVNTVPGVPGCFVSCAGESEAGYKEVEEMSKWLRGVFDGSHGENERILGRKWFELRDKERKKLRGVNYKEWPL